MHATHELIDAVYGCRFIFFLFFVFGLSIFAFVYLFSAFFSRAKVAATITSVLWLGAFFPFFGLADTDPAATKSNYPYASLFAPHEDGLFRWRHMGDRRHP